MPVLVELEKDILEPLELIAKDINKDVGYIIAEIVDKYLEELEDEYFTKLADERYADILSGKSKPIPFEEVLKRNGLSD